MAMYQMTGQKKHDRVFWIRNDPKDGPKGSLRDLTGGSLQVCWGKKKDKKFKSETLLEILSEPAVKSAADLFAEVDTDSSGQIDSSEFAVLYATARGEKLPKKQLSKALKSMDSDGSGQISLAEFEKWWKDNGGDLEKNRARAFTIKCGGADREVLTLLLVAQALPWGCTRGAWMAGCRHLLAANPPPADSVAPAAAKARQVPAAKQPSDEEPLEAAAAEEADAAADAAALDSLETLELPAEEDPYADDDDVTPQPHDDAQPWYDETQPMWEMYDDEDGTQVYEDLLTKERLDLSIHDPPGCNYWVWDDEDNVYTNMDPDAQVFQMDSELNPYYDEGDYDEEA